MVEQEEYKRPYEQEGRELEDIRGGREKLEQKSTWEE